MPRPQTWTLLFLSAALAACKADAAKDTAASDEVGADGADGTDGTDSTDGTDGTDGADGTDGTDGTDGGTEPVVAGDVESDLALSGTAAEQLEQIFEDQWSSTDTTSIYAAPTDRRLCTWLYFDGVDRGSSEDLLGFFDLLGDDVQEVLGVFDPGVPLDRHPCADRVPEPEAYCWVNIPTSDGLGFKATVSFASAEAAATGCAAISGTIRP